MLSWPATVNIRLGSEPTDMRQGSTHLPTSSPPPWPSARSQGHPLIIRSRRGGGTAVVLYSLTGTRKRHGIDPLAYLRDVLPGLPAHPADQLDEQRPDVWSPRTRPHGARQRLEPVSRPSRDPGP
jgi:hypothetical protein